MKKKADIFLPKGKESKNVEFKLVDGKIEVSYNLEDKFEPKDGDFIITSQGNIFIYNGNQSDISYGAYIGVMNMSKRIATGISNNGWTLKNGCRYATEQEKTAFLERLEKEYGEIWNAEKKCLEDVYVPKFGDIVRVETKDVSFGRNYMICIYPDKEFCETNDFFNPPLINLNGVLRLDRTAGTRDMSRLSPASEAEKQELFNKLAEVGKRWNPETKQIEDIRWRAEIGKLFYYVDTEKHNVLALEDVRGIVSERLYKSNNYFRTPEAAQKVADQIKEIFKNSKAE